ncbi:unnamed protein product [Cochlearia groenlandica]
MASTNVIQLNNLLRLAEPPQSSSSSVCLFLLRPFCFSSSKPRFQSLLSSSKPYPPSSTSLLAKSLEDYIDEPEEEEDEEEEDYIDGIEEISSEEKTEDKNKNKNKKAVLKLTIKEKKELAAYAHSLGDKLKCQLVGKCGVTDSVVFSFLETLEKNELLKVKIRKTSPDELDDAVTHLEEATGSVAVGQIGRTVILYRPSPTKLKAEAKKKEFERLSLSRRQRFTRDSTRPFRREEYSSERPYGRGRRGPINY